MNVVSSDAALARPRLVLRFAVGAIPISALLLAGCSPKTDRLEVSGDVTLAGVALDKGTIRFTSLGDGEFISTGALIQRGAYRIPQEKGLLPGVYHVEISSPDESAPEIIARSAPHGPGMPVAPERIPEQYNVNSDKQIEVRVDGDNRFDFNIPAKSK